MARTWLTIEVELVSGRGQYFWPRPGRLFVARRSFTFRQLAEAINLTFGRWELSHLHRFALADGSEVLPFAWWDEVPDGALDDARTKLSRLALSQQFAYEFDMGDGWEHVCTVGAERVEAVNVHGGEPDAPAVVFGWGQLPDQHGRDWRGDDGQSLPPPQPNPPASDLPPLMPGWGARMSPVRDHGPGWLLPLDWDEDSYRALRAAVYHADGKGLLDVLRRRDPLEVAHLAGDGLLVALGQGLEAATELAEGLAQNLRGRFHAGDGTLADHLDAAAGRAPEPAEEPIPVDLEELAMYLEGGDEWGSGMRLDIRTGQWWPEDVEVMTGEPVPDDWHDPDRWLHVTSQGSREAWEDMRDFIGELEDGSLAERLDRTIHGRGAFRSFKIILGDHPELLGAWYRLADDRMRGRAREWLAMAGYRPATADAG